MEPIVVSVDISRPPADVFAYVSDPSHLPLWQESVVRVDTDDAPTQVGTRVVVIRRAAGREMESVAEVVDFQRPTRWGVRGVDGPVRGDVTGTIEPLDNGTRSRVTLNLELTGHGVGRLLLPLFVQRQAKKEMPLNAQNLKELLESEGFAARLIAGFTTLAFSRPQTLGDLGSKLSATQPPLRLRHIAARACASLWSERRRRNPRPWRRPDFDDVSLRSAGGARTWRPEAAMTDREGWVASGG